MSSAGSIFTLKRYAAMVSGAMLLSLTACAAIPNLGTPPALKPADSYAATESFTAPVAGWPDAKWWAQYNDPQLQTLVDEALAGSPDLTAALARVRQADAAAEEAGASLLPTVDANGSVGKMKQSYNNGVPPAFVPRGYQPNGRATLDFNWELDFWGKNRNAVAAATSAADAARMDAEQAKLALTTSLVSAYATLAQYYADRDAAVEAVKVRHETTNIFQQRFQNGLETDGTLKQALANAAMAEADIQAIDESIALSKNGIAALLGAGPDRGLTINRPAKTAFKPYGLPATVKADLLGRRPDIIAARLRAEAAAKKINVAKANFYPDINLAAYFGLQSLGLGHFTDAGSKIGSFGPAVHLPIFEGGALRGAYKGARAEYDIAVAEYNGAFTHALQDVADVGVSSKALTGRLGKTREAVKAAEDAHRTALDRYKGGLATYLEVLNTEDLLITNRRAYADLQSRAFTLDVALVKALGGGFVMTPSKGK
ncbi:MAG: efflux transporter outer membrane subunit [Micavibrio sp.]|nr:efflux transporter outer membrane subunit [Micavibrio sp.]